VRTLATNYILYLMLYAMPQWIESVKGIRPANTGLILLPMTLMAISTGLLIAKRNNPVLQNILGVLVILTACEGLLLLNVHTPLYAVVGALLIVGTADGINMIANQSLLNREAPLAQKGVSFGLYRTTGCIGAIVSGTQLKSLFHDGVTDKAFHQIGYFALISASVLFLLLWPLIRRQQAARKTPGSP